MKIVQKGGAPKPRACTQGNRSALQEALVASRRELQRQVLSMPTDSGTGSDVIDTKDAAARNEGSCIEDAQLAIEMAELTDVEAALERMANGSFGICIECGEAIPDSRLQANPAASRCVGCQDRHERAKP